jgi:protein tyrosine phosphatase (PTP) superfamily phosphohydrolase (DUF442 family)
VEAAKQKVTPFSRTMAAHARPLAANERTGSQVTLLWLLQLLKAAVHAPNLQRLPYAGV